MKFSTSAPRGCADHAPQLTALFDGEADETAARQARAHLLSCPACARLWLAWTQQRDTLQREPVPTPPPTLLWRVLLSYRAATSGRAARPRPPVAATSLRHLETPPPPRLSQHILARTTRRSRSHVMLTPLSGPAPATTRHNARWFLRAPLWAAPALALWVLMLGRSDLTATFSTAPAATATAGAPVAPDVAASVPRALPRKSAVFAPIPVAPVETVQIPAAPPRPVALVAAPRPILRRENAAPTRSVVPVSRVAVGPTAPARISGRAGQGRLTRAFELAMSAGRRDMERINETRAAPAAPDLPRVVLRLASAPVERAASVERNTPRQTLAPRAMPRPARRQIAATSDATSRVTLAALAMPLSPVRTLSSARVRTASFSDDSMRPRVAHLSADGRRLAQLAPQDETLLRVSRPKPQAPTLRAVNAAGADNGPKLDELRSAVDEFRASVADDDYTG